MMLLRDGITIPTIVTQIPKDEASSEVDRQALISIIKEDIEDFDDLSHKDADVIFFCVASSSVSRYVAFNCLDSTEVSQTTDALEFNRSHFDSMSRGGWTEPHPNVHLFAGHNCLQPLDLECK